MELKSLHKKLPELFNKYKFVMLILVIGLVLMLLPSGTEKKETQDTGQTETSQQLQISVEQQLEEVLSQTSGVGQVRVLLTKGEGEETVYQTDTDRASSDTDRTDRATTVTVTDAQRNETGLVCQVNPPTYLGAIVVCQGADDPQVRLSVVDAVSKATGLGANSISVLKMK